MSEEKNAIIEKAVGLASFYVRNPEGEEIVTVRLDFLRQINAIIDAIRSLPEPKDMTYNGWVNYETWAVNLWFSSEEGLHKMWLDRAKELYREATSGPYEWQTRESNARYQLAEEMKDSVEESAPTTGNADMYADLLGAAISEVNWQDIAEDYLSDIEPEEEETEECEECGADIPVVDGGGLVNRHHLDSCSLYDARLSRLPNYRKGE